MTYQTNPPTIALSDVAWENIGDDGNEACRLLGHIRLGPMDMHLEAIEVDEKRRQISESKTEYIATMEAMEETEFLPLEIDGRSYIVFGTPYGR